MVLGTGTYGPLPLKEPALDKAPSQWPLWKTPPHLPSPPPGGHIGQAVWSPDWTEAHLPNQGSRWAVLVGAPILENPSSHPRAEKECLVNSWRSATF